MKMGTKPGTLLSICLLAPAVFMQSCSTELSRVGAQNNTQSLLYRAVYDSTTNESIVEGIVQKGGSHMQESVDPGSYALSQLKFIVNPIPRMSGYLYLPTRAGEAYVDRHVRIRGVISQEKTPETLGPGSGYGPVFRMSVSEIIIIEE